MSVTYEHPALDPGKDDEVRDLARRVAAYGPVWRAHIVASLAGG